MKDQTENRIINDVVFVIGQLGNGGSEKQLFNLIVRLRQEKIKVRCIVWNYDDEAVYVDAYHDELGDSMIGLQAGGFAVKKLRQLRVILRNKQPQLVISYTPFINFFTWLACFGLDCVAVGSLRASARSYMKKGGFKAWLNLLLPPRVLVNSHNAMKEIQDYTILNCFTKTAFLPNVLNNDRTRKQDMFVGEFQSISVGSARLAKRLDRLIQVMSFLKRKGQLNFRHIHVGGGAYLPTLRSATAMEGLEEELQFLGSREDVYELLRQSSIFLHFSEYEGSPNVIMEAMAAGLPVITTDCGDAGRYVEDGKNGFLVESFSVESFASKVALLQEDEVQRAAMGRHSLELIRASDWSMLPQYFLESLRQLGLDFHYLKEVNTTN